MISFGSFERTPVNDAGGEFRKTAVRGLFGTVACLAVFGAAFLLSGKARYLGLDSPCFWAMIVAYGDILFVLSLAARVGTESRRWSRGYLLLVVGLSLGMGFHLANAWPAGDVDMAFVLVHWGDVAAMGVVWFIYLSRPK